MKILRQKFTKVYHRDGGPSQPTKSIRIHVAPSKKVMGVLERLQQFSKQKK